MESIRLNGGHFVWAIGDKAKAFFFSNTGEEYPITVNRIRYTASFPLITPLFVKKVVRQYLEKHFTYERANQ